MHLWLTLEFHFRLSHNIVWRCLLIRKAFQLSISFDYIYLTHVYYLYNHIIQFSEDYTPHTKLGFNV